MSVVVAEAEVFEPGEDELAAARARAKEADAPLVLRINAAEFGAGLVEDLKSVFEAFPASARSYSRWHPRGDPAAALGPEYRVSASAALQAEIDQLLGPAAIAA